MTSRYGELLTIDHGNIFSARTSPGRTGDWWCDPLVPASPSRCARNHSYDSINIDAFECVGLPTELGPRLGDVEVERLPEQQPVVRRERREPQAGKTMHRDLCRRDRQCAHARAGAGVVDERLQRLAHRAELRGADVVDRRPRPVRRTHARVGKIGGVHELVAILATAEDEHRRAVGDELEQQRDDPEAAVTEDRARPDDRDVEAADGRVPAQQLGSELGPAVGLQRPCGRRLGHRVVRGDAEHRARRRVHDLCHRRASRAATSMCAVPVTFTASKSARSLCERHLRDVVEHDVDALARRAERATVPHVARARIPPPRSRAGRVHIEDAYGVSPLEQPFGEQAPEVAAAASDEHRPRHQSFQPRSRQKRTLARMPSNSETAGS